MVAIHYSFIIDILYAYLIQTAYCFNAHEWLTVKFVAINTRCKTSHKLNISPMAVYTLLNILSVAQVDTNLENNHFKRRH